MKKLVIIFPFCLFLILAASVTAQTLVPFRKENGKLIYVDSATMNPVIKEEFIFASLFTDNRAVVYNNTLKYYYWGHINERGQRISSSVYSSAFSFSEGYSTVSMTGSGYGYVDREGNEFLMGRYTSRSDFSNNRALVKKYDGAPYGYINKNGTEIIPLKYESAESFRDGFATVKLNGTWRIIDTSGNELATLACDYPGRFGDGLMSIKTGTKWNYVDKTGKLVFTQQFDEAKIFNEGLAAVKINGAWGFIDKEGKEIIPLKYEDAGSFFDGFAPVKKKGEWGYIDREGNTKISFHYDAAYEFNKGLGYVGITKKSKTTNFYIDMAGREYREK